LTKDDQEIRQRGAKGETKVKVKATAIKQSNLPVAIDGRYVHGAFAVRALYYKGQIHQGSRLGRFVTELENSYARHCGYETFAQCPVTVQDKIRLLVANWLFLGAYTPQPGSKTAAKEVSVAENLINRITSELGLRPAEKPVFDLPAAFLALQEREEREAKQ
jgi:hypothetical protein